jgi:hypothetical protein
VASLKESGREVAAEEPLPLHVPLPQPVPEAEKKKIIKLSPRNSK